MRRQDANMLPDIHAEAFVVQSALCAWATSLYVAVNTLPGIDPRQAEWPQ
jgi:hypothetical protein